MAFGRVVSPNNPAHSSSAQNNIPVRRRFGRFRKVRYTRQAVEPKVY